MKRVIKCNNTNNDSDFDMYETTLFTYRGSEKHVTIPDGVEHIQPMAFRYNTVETIKLPNSMYTIDYFTFSECTSLKSIHIPDSVTSIKDEAFQGCTSLASIDIPDSVTSIGESAFSECTSLKSIDIPEGVTRIQEYTFFKCKDLETVSLPSTLEYIDKYAFKGCISLKRVDVPEGVTFGKGVFDETPLAGKYQHVQEQEDQDTETISNDSPEFDDYFDEVWQAYCDRIYENYPDVEIDGAKQGYDGVTIFYLDGDLDDESYRIDERASYELLKECFENSVSIEDAIEQLDGLGV